MKAGDCFLIPVLIFQGPLALVKTVRYICSLALSLFPRRVSFKVSLATVSLSICLFLKYHVDAYCTLRNCSHFAFPLPSKGPFIQPSISKILVVKPGGGVTTEIVVR